MEEIGLLESFKLLRISRKYQTYDSSATDNEIKETFQEELQSIAAAEEAIFIHDLLSNLKGNKKLKLKVSSGC